VQVTVNLYHLEQLLAAAKSGLTEQFTELESYTSDSSEDRDARTNIYASISRLNHAIHEVEKKLTFPN